MITSPVFGRHGAYEWVDLAGVLFAELLAAVPDLVRGRHVAVTSFDSGPLDLTPEERASDWLRIGEVAWSPRVGEPLALPFEHYDEWYVFDEVRIEFVPADQFISYLSFRLAGVSPTERDDPAAPAWVGEVLDQLPAMQTRFWSAIERAAPVSWLAQNHWRTFVLTRDAALAEQVTEWAMLIGKLATVPKAGT